ncbi:hypothetical protein B5M09_000397 [Aphanomyces astaci]|uniref:BTB domain-containing protein n=1 Tax=Aphanomyces astaci TaxID=112090 RepID=A0A3R7Y412_APHAT|nr:hypothetical protein B5M09_000397 [Aphanomyces astaci]
MDVVYSWGRGEDGQLGLGDTSDQYRPVVVEALRERIVVQIACGSGHTVVLDDKGDVYTWGRGDDGRLGHGDNGWKFVPRLVESLQTKQIKQVTCGSYHTAAVTVSGELYTWGGGMYGKLGHGNEVGHSVPYLVETLSNLKVDQVACGSRHTVVLLQNSDVYTWGDKENGVSGQGDTDGHQYLPCAVEELKNKGIKQIAACGFHTAALKLYTFGEGKFGRLGHNNERNQIVAKVVDTLVSSPIRQVACGGFHTAAVSDTGEVFTWGNGDHGKLGHNDQVKVTLPRAVDGLHGKRVVSVASYNEHTVALVDPVLAFRPLLLSSTYASDMQTLVDEPDFADVVFLVESRRIFGHRAILAARCPHFKAMFSSGMRESRELEVPVPSIRIPVFLALLEYVYNDVVAADMTAEMAIELYACADMYGLDRLKGLCEVLVQKGLVVDNAGVLLQAADELHASRLREICMHFIIRHFDYVTKTEGFHMLSRDLILETLQNR